jgi:hypothetical protein
VRLTCSAFDALVVSLCAMLQEEPEHVTIHPIEHSQKVGENEEGGVKRGPWEDRELRVIVRGEQIDSDRRMGN